MEDRKFTEKQFDEAVFAVLDEMLEAECPHVALMATTMFARLSAELFRREEELNESEEKLIRAVSKDDDAQH